MIARIWLLARIVCLIKGHDPETISTSERHPTQLCTRCYATWRD